jgi:hypothetical protein
MTVGVHQFAASSLQATSNGLLRTLGSRAVTMKHSSLPVHLTAFTSILSGTLYLIYFNVFLLSAQNGPVLTV